MAKPKTTETRKAPHELPSLYCTTGRHWVETMERDPSLTFADDGTFSSSGPGRRAWICPLDRGEVKELPPSTAEVVKKEIHRADLAADREIKDQALTRKWGPLRKVAERLGGGSATTEQVKLDCGHQRAATKGVDEARCAKCRPKREAE
jgi:hypothetical protein